jgi:hypothetical protein
LWFYCKRTRELGFPGLVVGFFLLLRRAFLSIRAYELLHLVSNELLYWSTSSCSCSCRRSLITLARCRKTYIHLGFECELLCDFFRASLLSALRAFLRSVVELILSNCSESGWWVLGAAGFWKSAEELPAAGESSSSLHKWRQKWLRKNRRRRAVALLLLSLLACLFFFLPTCNEYEEEENKRIFFLWRSK